MDFEWQHYHRLNIGLLSAIGLWPYENPLVLRLKRIVGTFFVLTSCVAQLCTFFTVNYTNKLLLQNVPGMFVGCGSLVKYITFLTASDYIKKITEAINCDWKNLSSKEEIAVIESFVEKGKFHTKGFAMFLCPAGISLILLPFSSVFLDIVMPLNEPRNRTFPIMFESFVDQKEYFFLNLFAFDSTIIVALLTFLSTETLLIVYVQHARSLFEVTSCRIKERLSITWPRDPKRESNAAVIRPVIETHIRVIRFWKIIRETFLPSYLFHTGCGVLSLGAYLFRCTQTFASHEYIQFLVSAVFSLAIIGYMFYINFMLQRILDSSSELFRGLYDTQWYEFPTSTRKLVLFCMLNTVNPVAVDVLSIFVVSYEGFSVMFRMTLSYVMAMYSLQ